MTTQSNVCVCETCVGTQCTCGCQNPAPVPTASCQCGEVCNCGEGALRQLPARERAHLGDPVNMKAIVRETYGPPDVLHLEDVPVPTLGDGDVLVRVHAASANAGDWHLLRGTPSSISSRRRASHTQVQDHRHRRRRSRRSSRPERHPVPSRRRSIRGTLPMRLRCVCGIRGCTGEGAGVEAGQPVLRGSCDVTDRRLHGASRSSEGTDTTSTAGTD